MTTEAARPHSLDGKDPEKRARILEAARTVFQAKRYDDVPVSEITELAGIAKGTFYLYFPSKADLIAALAETLHEAVMVQIHDVLRTPRPLAETLEVMIRRAFTSMLEQRAMMNILELGMLLGDPLTMRDPHQDARKAAVVAMLEAAQTRGEINAKFDPHVAAELVGGVMMPLARVFVSNVHAEAKEAYLSESIAFLQRALGVVPAGPARGLRTEK
jgi:AcrR family transcriptional regulator